MLNVAISRKNIWAYAQRFNQKGKVQEKLKNKE